LRDLSGVDRFGQIRTFPVRFRRVRTSECVRFGRGMGGGVVRGCRMLGHQSPLSACERRAGPDGRLPPRPWGGMLPNFLRIRQVFYFPVGAPIGQSQGGWGADGANATEVALPRWDRVGTPPTVRPNTGDLAIALGAPVGMARGVPQETHRRAAKQSKRQNL
jgi:hypothetical protein